MQVYDLIQTLLKCDQDAEVYFNANAKDTGFFRIEGLVISPGRVGLLEELPDYFKMALEKQKEKNER